MRRAIRHVRTRTRIANSLRSRGRAEENRNGRIRPVSTKWHIELDQSCPREQKLSGPRMEANSSCRPAGLTNSAALGTAGLGVRMRAIPPGSVETGMLNRFTGTVERKAALAAIRPRQPASGHRSRVEIPPNKARRGGRKPIAAAPRPMARGSCSTVYSTSG
jgi:hypothetical protein